MKEKTLERKLFQREKGREERMREENFLDLKNMRFQTKRPAKSPEEQMKKDLDKIIEVED